MAYTKTPMESSEQTKTVPLVYEWEARNLLDNKDTQADNIVFEVVKSNVTGEQSIQCMKRDGSQTLLTIPHPSETILGLYYWDTGNSLYTIVVSRGHIYMYSFNFTLMFTITQAFSASSTMAGFTEFLYENGTKELVITDGAVLGTLTNSGVWTLCTDPDLPGHLPYPEFLDGYLFLATNNSIVNSDLNNPLSYVASNFIYAESYADNIRAMARVGNYLVTLGLYSTEWFYDAANPTGTPLAPYSGATQAIGYYGGLARYQNSIVFIGQSKQSKLSLYKIEGLKMAELPNGTVSRWLSNNNLNSTSATNGHILQLNGHSLYTFQNSDGTRENDHYMFDLGELQWTRLVFAQGTNVFIRQSCTAFNRSTGTERPATYFINDTTGAVKEFNPSVYRDSGVNFTVKFTTLPQTFGTNRVKFGGRLLIHGDQAPSTTFAQVSWSDDDYQTFSTPRDVDLSTPYHQLYALGSFRRRAFRITYADNFPMRWQMLELDYNQGQA